MSMVGVVPAAGRSSRIGNPKPLLDADGRTFLERVVDALREGGIGRILVGTREPRGPIPALVLRLGAEVITPERVEDGPIATLRAGLTRIVAGETPVDAVVYFPVDFPLVTGATVAALVEERARSGAPMVRPRQDGRTGHPVLFGSELFLELQECGLGTEGARTVVERHRAEGAEVAVEDPGIHIDIDTLPEYRRHFPQSYRKRFQKW